VGGWEQPLIQGEIHMPDSPQAHVVLPECKVMFDGIKADLREIKDSLSRLMWWLISILTTAVIGLVVSLVVKGT